MTRVELDAELKKAEQGMANLNRRREEIQGDIDRLQEKIDGLRRAIKELTP